MTPNPVGSEWWVMSTTPQQKSELVSSPQCLVVWDLWLWPCWWRWGSRVDPTFFTRLSCTSSFFFFFNYREYLSWSASTMKQFHGWKKKCHCVISVEHSVECKTLSGEPSTWKVEHFLHSTQPPETCAKVCCTTLIFLEMFSDSVQCCWN